MIHRSPAKLALAGLLSVSGLPIYGGLLACLELDRVKFGSTAFFEAFEAVVIFGKCTS